MNSSGNDKMKGGWRYRITSLQSTSSWQVGPSKRARGSARAGQRQPAQAGSNESRRRDPSRIKCRIYESEISHPSDSRFCWTRPDLARHTHCRAFFPFPLSAPLCSIFSVLTNTMMVGNLTGWAARLSIYRSPARPPLTAPHTLQTQTLFLPRERCQPMSPVHARQPSTTHLRRRPRGVEGKRCFAEEQDWYRTTPEMIARTLLLESGFLYLPTGFSHDLISSLPGCFLHLCSLSLAASSCMRLMPREQTGDFQLMK
ncbi:hypothetical protein B0T22DRAFT_453984 [Podospora appendiculata]|uniref:Uncharacterized protein n=1 Tax=Podospora appendiculata TaxID=314037 RepID=A0AAE0XKJ4_9PEZI|nr:hypothetical protein B0T22DRAFT_453984 [Podospora appendiculata]